MGGRLRGAAMVLATLLGLAGPAEAHTSYMSPNVFSAGPETERVTIQTSFTEDFLRPEFPVESQDFHLYRPNGQRDAYKNVVVLSQMTVLEDDLAEAGTYLFTTGERLGRTGLQAQVGGAWRPLEPGATAPAGAPTRRSQTATVANVYVTKGAPTNGVLAIQVGHLAIVPITHPSAIFLDSGFQFRVLFDGRPLANQEINLYRDGGGYDATPFHQIVRTDASGEARLSFERAGVYVIMTRASGDAPAGAATPVRSYTTSLTFEVAR